MFQIAFTPLALDHLRSLRKFDSKRVLDGIEAQLSQQPAEETRNRKRLRPNKLAEWELRIGKFRVFYDVVVAESLVKIEAIGYKEGNKLFILGEEYSL
jgi:mRNA-degrading endonuclease RelE of RelBE toxin-antitoxin system